MSSEHRLQDEPERLVRFLTELRDLCCLDPAPFLEIRDSILDGLLDRPHVNPQNSFPLLRAERHKLDHFRRVIILDTRQNVLYSKRKGRPLCRLDKFLIRNWWGGNEDPFISCFFFLKSCNVSSSNVSDVDPCAVGVEIFFAEDGVEKQVKPSLRG